MAATRSRRASGCPRTRRKRPGPSARQARPSSGAALKGRAAFPELRGSLTGLRASHSGRPVPSCGDARALSRDRHGHRLLPGPGSPPLTAGAQRASPPEGGCGSSSSSCSSTSHRECPRPSAVTSAGRGGWPGTAARAPGPEDAARHLTPVAMGQGAPRSLRVGRPRSARADDPCHRSHLFRPPVWALRPRALEAAEAGP